MGEKKDSTFEREREIFFGALEWETEDGRERFLDQTCGDDPKLMGRVRKMLEHHDDDDETLEMTLPGARRPAALTEQEGDLVGPYKLLQQIGEGGFGTVWMAEQSEPISRKVALKVIKAGMDTREVLARFEAERQAVALMDHPNITKVLDAGATASGRPYLAMELVKGIPITRFCDERGLGTHERLALFGDVCDAINHAHQKGIIHRDIKPNNVLVTLHGDKAVVKVIDFGIAKATQSKLTDKTLFTRYEQFIGTPVYMSPEQASLSGLDIDTRSDIYALGVMLYELLTGKPPFDGRTLISAGYEEMRRIIREEEPPRPSLRLSTASGEESSRVTSSHGVEPHKLSRVIRGELDWIVMKAIEKDRTRRYETANAFAADIGRYLNDEPVQAAAPSAAYKFKKFARRNKTTFAVAAAMALLLVAGTAVSTWQALRATKAEKDAVEQADRALVAEKQAVEQADRAGIAEKLAVAEADRALAAEKLAKEQAERAIASEKRAVEQAERALAAEKKAEATALAERAAREESEEINAFMISVFSSPDPSRGGRSITVAETLDNAGRMLDLSFAYTPERRAKLRATLGNTYHALGLYEDAIALQEKVRDFYRDSLGEKHADTLTAMADLASSYAEAGRREEALELGEKVLEHRREAHGEQDAATLSALARMAHYYYLAGQRKEALAIKEEVLKGRIELLGEDDLNSLGAKSSLATSYFQIGRYDDALKMREEVYNRYLALFGRNNLNTLGAMANLAFSYKRADRLDEALAMQEAVLEGNIEAYGEEHPDTLGAMTNLASTYEDVDRLDDAIELQERSLAIKRRVLPENHPFLGAAMGNLSSYYAQAKRWDEALDLGEELLELSRRVNGEKHPETISAMGSLATLYSKAGLPDEALKLGKEVLQLCREVHGEGHPATLRAMNNLVDSHQKADRWDEALKLGEELLGQSLALYGVDHAETLQAMWPLANNYRQAGRLEEAAATLCVHAERLRRSGQGPETEIQLQIDRMLAVWADEQSGAPVSQEAVARYHAEHPELFREASVHLHTIMVRREAAGPARAEQRQKVEALLKDIVSGIPFAKVAREHSQDSWAEDGGDRGWIERGTYGLDLELAIFSMEPGTVAIHADPKTLWILLVADREEGEEMLPLDEVSEEIVEILQGQGGEQLIQRWRQDAVKKLDAGADAAAPAKSKP